MKREIKFKGQLIETKEWVYGTYHYSNDGKNHYILNREKMLLRSYHDCNEMALHEKEVHLVIPETVVQFTGFTDHFGLDIYDGDIVQTYCYNKMQRHEVKLDRTGWTAGGYQLDTIYFTGSGSKFKVIGNIHDVKEQTVNEAT